MKLDKKIEKRLEQFVSTNYTLELDSDADFTFLSDEDASDVKEFCAKFTESMDKHFQLWRLMGLFGSRRNERKRHILGLHEEIINDSIEKDMEAFKSLNHYVESKSKEINLLLEELKLKPYDILQEDWPLIPKAKKLIDKYDEITALAKERVEQWNELEKSILELRTKLDIAKSPPKFSTRIPLETDIEILQSELLELRKLKTSRLNILRENQKAIRDLIDVLEITENEKINEALCKDEENLILSKSFLDKVENLKQKLENESKCNEKTMESLKIRLNKLWETLGMEEKERENAVASIDGWKPSSIERMKDIVNTYEKLKKENLGAFIEKTRLEIMNLWNKCFCSKEERQNFSKYLNDDAFTDDLLVVHEKELDRLKDYYVKNSQILENFEEWLKLWQLFLDLEKESQDPARLLDRRRNLFKEQKIKKETEKNLLKTEKHLTSLCEEYTRKTKSTFLVEGISLLNFISESWIRFNENKENDKKDRKRTRDKENTKTINQSYIHKRTPILIPRTFAKIITPGFGSLNCTQSTRIISQPYSPSPCAITRSKTQARNVKDSFKICRPDNILSPLPTTPTTVDQIIEKKKFLAEMKDRQQGTFFKSAPSQNSSTYYMENFKKQNTLNSSFRKDPTIINFNTPLRHFTPSLKKNKRISSRIRKNLLENSISSLASTSKHD